MASAGMCFDDHPAASADDALDRESIMRLSKQRAAERYGESFACTVYVGDGIWDARACRSVGIPFIGIGTGSRATGLSAEGAVCVFSDFSDADIFLRSVYEITNAAYPCAAANGGIALRVQSPRLVAAVAQLGSLGVWQAQSR